MLQANRNFGLDFTRAIAVLFVLLAHFVKKIDFIGFWGVELFFGLSGFLIGGILWRDLVQPDQINLKYILNFLLRRWFRTLPNYYLFLLIMIIFHYYVIDDLKSFNTVFAAIWFGNNFLSRESNFYGVSWSLCIEEWFYVIFPFLLLVGNLLGLKKHGLFIISSVFLIVFSITIRFIMYSKDVAIDLRAITLARFDAIVYGVIIAYFSNTFFKKKYLHFIFLLMGIIGLLLSLLFIKRNESIYELYLLILAPLSCALILPILTHFSVTNPIFLPFKKMIENISLWSYSIYLCHIPVLITIYMVMQPIRDSITGNLISKIFGFTSTFLVASFIYKKFEQPFISFRPKSL